MGLTSQPPQKTKHHPLLATHLGRLQPPSPPPATTAKRHVELLRRRLPLLVKEAAAVVRFVPNLLLEDFLGGNGIVWCEIEAK